MYSASEQEDFTCEETSINNITSKSKLFTHTSSKPFMLMGAGKSKIQASLGLSKILKPIWSLDLVMIFPT